MNKQVLSKLTVFFTTYKHQLYKKGEVLIRADEDPSGIFFLKNGFVKEYTISQKGDEIVVNIFKPISFFPMSWAMNGTHNNYFFEAINTVEVWKAPKEKVLEFIKKEPEILYDLLKRVYMGTDGMLTRMTYLMSGNAHTRLLIELLIYMKRFGIPDKNKISYKVRVTESDLAAHAGITRETVSREIKVLKDKGLIQFKTSMLSIPNIKKLETELSASF